MNGLVEKIQKLYETYDWKLTYTQMYCAYCWTGIHTWWKSSVSALLILDSFWNDLIISGGNQPKFEEEDNNQKVSNTSDSLFEGVLDADSTNTISIQLESKHVTRRGERCNRYQLGVEFNDDRHAWSCESIYNKTTNNTSTNPA